MSTKQVLVGILSGLLIIAVALNIYVDVNFVGWAIVISWMCTIAMLSMAIYLFVGLFKILPPNHYNAIKIILIVADILSFFVFIIFIINGLFNWAKIISLVVITPLIVSVYLYMKELQNSSDMTSSMNSPYQEASNQTPIEYNSQNSNSYQEAPNQIPVVYNSQNYNQYQESINQAAPIAYNSETSSSYPQVF